MVLARQVMAEGKPDDTVDQRLSNLDPYQRWAQVLGQDLRYFRASGFDGTKAHKLRMSAEVQAKATYEKYGWDLPPTTLPGVQPLD